MNASGPINGRISCLPNVMFNPESTRMMKQTAAIQCAKRSKAEKRAIDPPGPAGRDPHRAEDEVKQHNEADHAEDGDGADPGQRDLMEPAPVTAGRLLERAGLLVGDRAFAGNALELAEQLLLLDRIRQSD